MKIYCIVIVFSIFFCSKSNSQNNTSTCGEFALNCGDNCVSVEHICDGIKDCKSGLDESQETCATNECPEYTFRCSTGACIEKSKVCDKIADCLDSSDEAVFVCSEKLTPVYEDCGYSDFVNKNGEFPWTVTIYKRFFYDELINNDDIDKLEEYDGYCKGTLVTPNTVISELHCFDDDDVLAVSAWTDDEARQERNIAEVIDPLANINSYTAGINVSVVVIVKLESSFVFNTFTYAACLDSRPIELQNSLDVHQGVVAVNWKNRIIVKEVLSFCGRLTDNISVAAGPCLVPWSFFEPLQPKWPFLNFVKAGHGLFNIVDDRYYLRSIIVLITHSFGNCDYALYQHIRTNIDFIKTIDPPSHYLANNYSLWKTNKVQDNILSLDVVSNLSRICGKFETTDYHSPYPWHAAIWIETNGAPKRICAGTIIAPKYIVTAVSCFWDFQNNEFRDLLYINEYSVSAGFNGETFAQFSKVFHVHTDNYLWESNGQSDVNNIAIIEIIDAFTFDRDVKPACIDFEEDNIQNIFQQNSTTMISWLVKGDLDIYTPSQLRGTFLSNAFCSEYLNNRCAECEAEVPDDQSKLCMTHSERGSPTDYGAGIFTQTNGKFYLRGTLNRPVIPDDTSLSVYYRLFTNILPFTKLIKTILNTYQPEGDIIFEPGVCDVYNVPCDNGTCIVFFSICNNKCDCDNCTDEYELMCNKKLTPKLYDDCGKFDGGYKPWRPNIFVPWHAGILVRETNDFEIICAASIVSPMYLISAANCFWDTTNNSISTRKFFVGAGYENNNTFLQYRNVSKIITNGYLPEYWWNSISRESHFNNIAIVKLETPLNFDEHISAVCLTSVFEKPQYYPHFDPYTLVSWSNGNLYGQSYGKFVVTMFSNKHCREIVPDISTPEYMDSHRKKCFYVGKCGPDNDNGNGLSIKIDGRYYLYAVSNPKIRTQRGFRCQYYMFTTLGLHFDFIKSNIIERSSNDTSIKNIYTPLD